MANPVQNLALLVEDDAPHGPRTDTVAAPFRHLLSLQSALEGADDVVSFAKLRKVRHVVFDRRRHGHGCRGRFSASSLDARGGPARLVSPKFLRGVCCRALLHGLAPAQVHARLEPDKGVDALHISLAPPAVLQRARPCRFGCAAARPSINVPAPYRKVNVCVTAVRDVSPIQSRNVDGVLVRVVRDSVTHGRKRLAARRAADVARAHALWAEEMAARSDQEVTQLHAADVAAS
mmetsp:Transcript_9109/g.31946  ORF Transcript_9109/g.31946 Transcript_9109/m.31946 type:complete len:234 (-) Transcript_9109:88-789(-)